MRKIVAIFDTAMVTSLALRCHWLWCLLVWSIIDLCLLHRSCSPIRGPIVQIIFGENLQVTMCPCSIDLVAAWERWENLIKREFLVLVVPNHFPTVNCPQHPRCGSRTISPSQVQRHLQGSLETKQVQQQEHWPMLRLKGLGFVNMVPIFNFAVLEQQV